MKQTLFPTGLTVRTDLRAGECNEDCKDKYDACIAAITNNDMSAVAECKGKYDSCVYDCTWPQGMLTSSVM